MDVSLGSRLFCLAILSVLFLNSCGNRYDLETERGRQARIDDANYHLSKGECGAAHEAINPLYNSSHVDDEVRIVKASAHACDGGFNLLTLAGNLDGASNYFQVLAKSMNNTAGDSKRASMYSAVDVLTQAGTKLDASQRSTKVNTYMVFIQLGVAGAILRNYGNPTSSGAQGANLDYTVDGGTGAGEMSMEDACGLTAAFAIMSDSFSHSSLTDDDSTAVNASLNSSCVAAGLASCSAGNKDRSACDEAGGAGDPDTIAAAIVTQVNSGW